MARSPLIAALVLALSLPGAAAAQLCEPWWSPGFSAGDPLAYVRAQLSVVEQGQPVLYAGDSRGVWRWDGDAWTNIGPTSTAFDGGVYALAVYDDGSGPALYAGGNFTLIGGVGAQNIAKWDGEVWSPLASGLRGPNGAPPGAAMVRALHVFDSGSGPELVAGGGFTQTGAGPSLSRVARWNGIAWSALGTGMTGPGNPPVVVNALTTYAPAGGTPALYATGVFSSAGGVNVGGIARWNGAAWSALPGGSLTGTVPEGRALAVYDDGAGPKLYIGGQISGGGAVSSFGIVRWNGVAYSVIPSPQGNYGANRAVSGMLAVQGGQLDGLYVGGYFTRAGNVNTNGVARYSGAGWSALGAGLGATMNDVWNEARSLALHVDGRGPAVFVGGNFVLAGDIGVNHCARWTGAEWTAVGSEHHGVRGFGTLRAVDSGPMRGLYALGIDGVGATLCYKSPLRWDGLAWSVLPLPAASPDRWVGHAAVSFDSGAGEALYVAWTFGPQGYENGRVSRWDGAAWTTIGSVAGGESVGISDMAVYDDGSGPALYITGTFSSVDGVAAANIARWTGAVWQPLGSGLTGTNPEGQGPHGQRLGVRDGALYVAGAFAAAGGTPASCVACWSGSWTAAAPGTLNLVSDMAVLGPATSPAARVLIGFTVFPHTVTQPDDVGWIPFGTTPPVMPMRLGSFDDGYGERALVSGFGPGGTLYLYRWTATPAAWEPVAGGLSNTAWAMASFDDDGPGPTPPSLWCLGGFATAGAEPSSGIARLNACPPACRADWNRDGFINSLDISLFLGAWLEEIQNPAAGFDADLNRDGVTNSTDISAFLAAWLAGLQGGC